MDFVGREVECSAVGALLGEHRLVTLVGPGGIGKTRLAGEIARRVGDGYDGGVLTSELSGVESDGDIVSVVARQLGFDSLDAVRLRAADAPTLIILDNCESALTQAASVANHLTETDADIVVLATSRAPLRARGERVVTLDALDLPTLDEPAAVREAAAAQLFIDRAGAAGASWEFSDENLLAIGRLVRQLDGLPLAIELAAARSRILAPPELVRLLDRQLDLLAQPGATDDDRHGSLRSAILTSYEPLPAEQQAFLRRLSIIPAPFDLTLAHRAAGSTDLEIDTIDVLTALVDASLVAVRPGARGGLEYRLLDSIRAFGREQLDEAAEAVGAGERYVEAMVAFSDEIMAEALAAFTPDLLGRIRDQFVHLSSAIDWCLDHDDSAERAYRLVIPLYGPTGARTEVADLARRVDRRWDGAAPLQAEALAVMGMAIFLSGSTGEAVDFATRAIEHPDGSTLARMVGQRVLGFAASVEDRTDDARAALAAAVELAIPFSESFARELRISWAGVVVDPAESPDAIELVEEVYTQAARQGEMVNVAWAAVALAYHHCLLGNIAAARRVAEAGLDVADRTGFPWSIGAAHRTMASVLAEDEGWAAAAPHFRAALDQTVSVGDVEGTVITIRAGAAAARRLGDHGLAAELWAAVPPLRGRSVIRLIHSAMEDELEEELGLPLFGDLSESVSRARQLFGPALGSTPPAPAQEPEPGVGHGGGEPEPAAATSSVLSFGDYEIDLAMHELRRAGERVHVEPQVFDVLAYLAARQGALVRKEELLDEVWGDRFVSDSALSSRIKAARQATGDDGRRQEVIRTVHGKGFTFVADLG